MMNDADFKKFLSKFNGLRGHSLTQKQYDQIRVIIDPCLIRKETTNSVRCDRGFIVSVGDYVRFQYAIPRVSNNGIRDPIDTGQVKYINGAYIGIACRDRSDEFIAERYPNEILEVCK